MKKPTSLRAILATVTVLVTALAVLSAGALVGMTTILRETTARSGTSVEAVRLAEEIQTDLLLHERAKDPLLKRQIESEMRRKVLEARRFVTGEREARKLAEAESKVDSYVTLGGADVSPAGHEARQGAAYDALEELVIINVEQSKAAERDAARWNTVGNAVGGVCGALVVLVATALVAWLSGRAFKPIIGLASAMDRFGRGDRDVRAAEDGPSEIREMCRRFNQMASVIAVQRSAQIAFLGGVAHDLRNPLSVLRMSVPLLASGDRPPPAERLTRTVEKIDRQITRMERMLGDFLDVAKIEAGELELRLDVHDARALVLDVARLFDGVAPEHRLEVRVPDDFTPVCCDQLRIEQVLTNLISNALKYSPGGSKVEVVLKPREDELELSVVDHGVGIAENDRARMFEPFRRIGLSAGTVPGVGLGLFVVRKIIDAHRGRIEVESVVGSGSEFRVFLPASHESIVRCGSCTGVSTASNGS